MKNNKGFSLVELILVLSVIAGLSITAFLLYEKVSNESIVKAESQNMSVVLAGTKSEKIEKAIRNKSRMNELSKSLKEVVNNVSIAEKSPTVENKKAILNSLLDLNLKIGTDNYTHNNSKILERINSIVEENKLEKNKKILDYI